MSTYLPHDYLEYVESTGVFEGETLGEPGRFQLWPIADIEDLNANLELSVTVPGFLGFGTNCGSEMLAFDNSGAVYAVPFVDLKPTTPRMIAKSWGELRARIVRENTL